MHLIVPFSPDRAPSARSFAAIKLVMSTPLDKRFDRLTLFQHLSVETNLAPLLAQYAAPKNRHAMDMLSSARCRVFCAYMITSRQRHYKLTTQSLTLAPIQ